MAISMFISLKIQRMPGDYGGNKLYEKQTLRCASGPQRVAAPFGSLFQLREVGFMGERPAMV